MTINLAPTVLFKLKEWLTVPDVAKHLSTILDTDITEADVLRLALDKHLKLSINFVNKAAVKHTKDISWKDTEWILFPRPNTEDPLPPETNMEDEGCPLMLQALWSMIPEGKRKYYFPVLLSKNIDGKRFLANEPNITEVSGVWDLPLIGSERLDIEHQFQQLTGGPVVTLSSSDGAYVEGENGVMCLLQKLDDYEDYIDYENHQAELKTKLRDLEEHIVNKKISRLEAQELLDKHNLEGKNDPGDRILPKSKWENYYSADSLPDDGVLVVRTSALQKFEQSLADATTDVNKPLNASERDSLLKLLIGMAVQGYRYNPEAKKSGVVTEIKTDLERLGITLNEDTIRIHLRHASTKLPAKPTND